MEPSFINHRVIDRPSDIELRVAGGRSFYVHQVILETSSVRFKAIVERARLQNEKVVELLNLNAETAERMLRFIYSSQEPPEGLDYESLFNLYIAAEDYALDELKGACSVRLGNELNHTNFLKALKIADRYNDAYIMRKIMEYAAEHGTGNLDPMEMLLILRDSINRDVKAGKKTRCFEI